MLNSYPEHYRAVFMERERDAVVASRVSEAERLAREGAPARQTAGPWRRVAAAWQRRTLHAPSAGGA